LRSLAGQDYPADRREVIVVDNGSTDDSREVATAHGATVLCHPKLRVGALRNCGVQASRGEVLAFVDSDHEVPPDWLATGVASLQQEANRAAVGAPCLAPRDGAWVQRVWEVHRLRNHRCGETRWLGAGNLFVRRDAFDLAGGFSADLIAAEDVDLCARLAARAGHVFSDPSIANVHHGEPRTLRAFFHKEFWRGSSGVRAFWLQGMPWRELPSLLFPAYHLLALAAFIAGGVLALRAGHWIPFALAGLALVTPAGLLAIRTAWKVRRPSVVLGLTALYLTYGLARAFALFR
jgi:glycosyltransferase involved in cell wall biosynthesis